jgi:hypothetical protein
VREKWVNRPGFANVSNNGAIIFNGLPTGVQYAISNALATFSIFYERNKNKFYQKHEAPVNYSHFV